MKKTFEQPTMKVVEVKQQDIICESAGVQDYGWNEYFEE